MAEVIRTFPPVGGEGLWLDVVRDGPGNYAVNAVNNPAGNPIGYGWTRPNDAIEWVVQVQDQQREQLRHQQHMQQLVAAIGGAKP